MKIDAIILAGGMGTRLRSLIADRPKVLARVNGRPFITFLLEQLAAAGIESVILSTGYMAEAVESEIGGAWRQLRIGYSREQEPLGTGGGVRLALNHTHSNPVLVLNGDSFCAVDFCALMNFHETKGAAATLALAAVEDSNRFGRVEIDGNEGVVSFEEKGCGHSPGWINAGVYCLRREVVEMIPNGGRASLEREAFPSLAGHGLYGFRTNGKFLDIGTPESYAEAGRFFA